MQPTDKPRETHLETKPNEVEWAPRGDRLKHTHSDNIPGSPGYNSDAEVQTKPRDTVQEQEGVNVSSHALNEVPAPEKGTTEEGYTPVEVQKH